MIWPRSLQSGWAAQENPCLTEIPSKNSTKMTDFGYFACESL